MIDVRDAQKSDTGAIAALLEQVLTIHHNARPDIFKEGVRKYTDEEIEEILLDAGKRIFVAELDGKVVGYAFIIFKETKNDNILCDSKSLYIDDLCIDESVRGAGVGTAIFKYLKAFAYHTNCNSITLNVWEANRTAKKFYEKMGLVPQKTIMEMSL